eukprot:CAMPEP_0173133926 /NCGR_PEP_ID=MMETSP1105-20130129/998_1 /TAXON_ID=2985 /ORGANISM="Ochromonas sp., Strain BG-1" /LENGTH=71 /DNA_ID=CAMNT_0014045649 /DNA_START=72 /DNA_END=287 /DNA_ORIENTATION=-
MSIVHALEKMPKSQAVGLSVIAAFGLSGVISLILASKASKPHTMTKEWQAANIEYMKFQKMNPIFGISSKP